MKPYPKNNINYESIIPTYISNNISNTTSRYSVYRLIENEEKQVFEIRLTNSISSNTTFRGYYYTTTKYETLYEIAKLYYNDESYYWILAKANQLKDDAMSSLKPGTTVVIPLISELQSVGGYFSNKIKP